ncbi:hypothetical protein Tco_0819439 [Tanacetum coccineum]|uniref:Uncharacterized protein n=1 Tax=Tanacetum coccineum TaxID=301880 RepID=A0ABQ5A6K7_9ASTR
MVVFKVLKNHLQQFITMQISMDFDDQKTNHFFTEYTLCDAQIFQNILIILMDSIEKAIVERGLYKRAHDNKVHERTRQTHEGMLSLDALEIDNNIAGASHDKDNITEVQSSNNQMFENILKKTKNALELFEKTKMDHKMLTEENVLLEKEIEAYKERDEDKYVNNIIQLEAKNKDLENIVCKMGKSSQTLRMLANKQSLYRENKRKMGLGYMDPCPLGQAIACHLNLYDAEVLSYQCVKPDAHDTEEILNDAEESQVKMKEKQFQFNYENINSLYDTFVPQTELSPEQEYFTDPSISSEYESSKEMSDLPTPEMPKKVNYSKRRWISDSQNTLRQFYKTDVNPMSLSLMKSSKELQQELTKEVQESYVKIKNKEEIEQFSKESKYGDKFCNDVVEVKEKLSKQIVQLEKDFAKLEAQSIAFQIALQHKTQKNKSLKTFQKENENFLASLQIKNAHLKQTYKELFESVQSSRVESNQCDEVKIKLHVDEIETQNIELEYQVASLLKENEYLKMVYKNLFDSIRKSRVQTQSSNVTQNKEENLRSKLSEFEDEKFDQILGKDDSFPSSIAKSNISKIKKESGENLCENSKCELPTKNLCVEFENSKCELPTKNL